ncbi:MAG TPA: PQQ-dependent sugar dehydrogenase, partial [Polyangiaceae bacterium]
RSAQADLTGEFADALDVDTEFVTGVNAATDIAFAADGRAVVTQKSGQITVRRTDGTKNVVMGAFGDVDTQSEKGLLGVVAHPSEENTFFFYVSNGDSNGDKHRVYKGSLGDDDSITVDLDNPIIAASVGNGPGLEGPANHDGGGLFIHDNHLFVGVGDTGSNSTPPSNKYSSCLNKGNGKILRVALDGSVPSDNPLVGVDDVTACDEVRGDWGTDAPDERVYAWGFRNPWRFWIDPHSNRMWVGDVGETTREEVSVSAPTGDGWMGEHFGYPFVEGTEDYGDLDGVSCDDGFSPERECVGPVHDYGRTEGTCVIGGIIPEGCGWNDAFGGTLYYFFADFSAAWIHALEVNPDRSGAVSGDAVEAGSFTGSGPASIRQGPGGAMYVVMNGGGAVYEIKPKNQTGDDCQSMGGSGGTGGTGATSGSGGDGGEPEAGTSGGGTGGAATAGRGGSSAGSAGRGGSSGSAGRGGSGTSGSSGTTGTAGSNAGAGGGSGGGENPDEDEGCGCRVVGTQQGSLAALFGALGLAGAAFFRRRSRSPKA